MESCKYKWDSHHIRHWGKVYAASTEQGVCQIMFASNLKHSDLLKNKVQKKSSEYKNLQLLFEEIKSFVSGRLTEFKSPIDLSDQTVFTRKVLNCCLKIPFGKYMSYGELATKIKKPTAARAVGQAMGRNPVPLLIPCHRVLASGDKLGGFSAGLDLKRKLLQLESISYSE